MLDPIADKAALLTRRPRTRKVLTDADMERLHRLYYDTSVDLARVAETFGLPVSTLLRWIGEMDWPRRSRTTRVTRDDFGPLLPATTPEPTDDDTPPLDLDETRLDAALAVRAQLRAMRERRAHSLTEHERNARIIGSLSRSLERIDESLGTSALADRLAAQLAKRMRPSAEARELAALARDVRAAAREAARTCLDDAEPPAWRD